MCWWSQPFTACYMAETAHTAPPSEDGEGASSEGDAASEGGSDLAQSDCSCDSAAVEESCLTELTQGLEHLVWFCGCQPGSLPVAKVAWFLVVAAAARLTGYRNGVVLAKVVPGGHVCCLAALCYCQSQSWLHRSCCSKIRSCVICPTECSTLQGPFCLGAKSFRTSFEQNAQVMGTKNTSVSHIHESICRPARRQPW